MGKGLRRPSPSMIVALCALVVAMSGGAYAAVKIGSNKIKANAIKTSKIADDAVTGAKIADGAVAGPQIAAGAVTSANLAPGTIAEGVIPDGGVTTNKLADGAVTAEKIGLGQVGRDQLGGGAVGPSELDPSERSEAFTASHAQVSLPASTDTVAIQTSLPSPGNYVFTVSAQIGNATGGSANSVSCNLLDANNPLASSVTALTTSATFQQTISLTGVSDGGTVRLSCNPDLGASIRNLVLTATRAGFVQPLSSTP